MYPQKRKGLRQEARAEIGFRFLKSRGQGHFLDPRPLSPGRAWGPSPVPRPREPPEGQRLAAELRHSHCCLSSGCSLDYRVCFCKCESSFTNTNTLQSNSREKTGLPKPEGAPCVPGPLGKLRVARRPSPHGSASPRVYTHLQVPASAHRTVPDNAHRTIPAGAHWTILEGAHRTVPGGAHQTVPMGVHRDHAHR